MLLCGMLGIVRLGPWEYFKGVRTMLEAMGCEVFTPHSPWGQNIARRASVVAEQLRDIPGPLHIIAHSMGGVDARYLITHLGGADRVASLTTLATPHRGSSAADHVARVWFSPWRFLPAVRDLKREAMAAFNARTPDHPDVVYRSYSAARPLEEQPWLVRRFGRIIERKEGANDSQVSVTSAQWGEHVATLPADHFEIIGMNIWLNPWRKRVRFDHMPLYRDIAAWILAREHPSAEANLHA